MNFTKYLLFILILVITSLAIDIKQIEFENKIDKFLINNLNEHLYIVTNNEILILNKNLAVLQSNSNETNCLTDSKYQQQQIYIFDINYSSNTILECSRSSTGNIRCRIRDLTNLKCIYDNANEDIKEFNFKKALSISKTASIYNNYFINKNNFLYFMPTIKSIDKSEDFDDIKLLYIFNLNLTNLFQSIIILNNAFDIEREYFLDKEKILNVVYKFSDKAYVYYLYVFNDKLQKITKLLRFCDVTNNNEKIGNIRSSELQLKCNENSIDYTEAVDAYFIRNTLFVLFKSSSSTATILCSISLNQVNSFFMNYIHSCLQAPSLLSSKNPDVFLCKTDFQQVSDASCDCDFQSSNKIQSSALNDETFCSSKFDGFINIKKSFNLNIVSNFNLETDEYISKLHSSFINGLQVLFIVSNKNYLHAYKVLVIKNGNFVLSRFLRNDLKQFLTSKTRSPEDVIVNNIDYNELSSFLYLSLNRKLLKIDLNDCSAYSTCTACSISNNPYCGWCIFSNKCTSRSKCLKDSIWLFNTTNNASCPLIRTISYNEKPYSLGQSSQNSSQIYLSPSNNNLLKLSINFKLESTHKLTCLLVDTKTNNIVQEINAVIEVKTNQVICAFSAKMNSNDNSNDLILDIKLKVVETNEIITFIEDSGSPSFRFIYINCMNRISCGECLNENSCKWDPYYLGCVPTNGRQSSQDVKLVDSKSKCLKYKILKLNKNLTYNQQFSTNTNNIEFEILNLQPNFFSVYSISCQFNDSHQINAILMEKRVNTAKYQCSYLPRDDKKLSPYQTEQFVYFNVAAMSQANKNSQTLIDNLNEIKLNIVNCELAASNCGYCLQNHLLDLNCGWCMESSRCTTSDNCGPSRENWLSKLDNNDYADCPSPIITDIEPKCGPVTGGTQLSIYGVNLGHRSTDMDVYLYKSNDYQIKCEINATLYIKSAKIICMLETVGNKFMTNSSFDLRINVNTSKYSKNITTIENNNGNLMQYQLILPSVSSIWPKKTILSGGTLIRINGINLNCGSFKEIYFGDKKCNIVIHNRSK